MMVSHQEKIYMALGSNRGDRKGQLEEARERLTAAVQIKEVSPIYETEPWGYLDQNDFLNQVIEVKTDLEPLELLGYLKDIEGRMGREEGFRYGPRVIDLDILLYGNRVYSNEQLQIPHPRMTERAFVMIPLLDLAPDLVIPGTDQTVREIAGQLERSGVEVYHEAEEGEA